MEKTAEPRQWLGVYLLCHAPQELFVQEWNQLSPAAEEWYLGHALLPCADILLGLGSGDMNPYCVGCRFCDVVEE